MANSSLTTNATSAAPLEEVMLAMDVVDTLRHRQVIVDRELDEEARRLRLIERLREIYQAQGIEVSDAVLAEGVKALEEDRFTYKAPEDNVQTRLAKWYVGRGSWGKPALLLLGVVLLAALVQFFAVSLPQTRERASLPGKLDSAFARVVQISEDATATDRAQQLLDSARIAMQDDQWDRVKSDFAELRDLSATVESSYQIRVVSRPAELSGVWRVPEVNPSARNYYLIVEAIKSSGARVKVLIDNEEDGRRMLVDTWGVRVSKQTFDAVAADKGDDGIIQDDVIGRKISGRLEPEFLVETTGATITEW